MADQGSGRDVSRRDHPSKVAAGEPVLVYVVNMLEYEQLASFHPHLHRLADQGAMGWFAAL